MSGWLGRRLGRRRRSAREAKDRLQLLLIHDRTDLTPDSMASLKNDLLDVISRYIEIDTSSVSIEMTRDGRQQRLLADIPIRPIRRSRLG